MSGPDLDELVTAARGHQPGAGRLKRVVVRLPPDDVARLDRVRKRWPRASRAGVVRAFTLLGLAFAEAEGQTPTE